MNNKNIYFMINVRLIIRHGALINKNIDTIDIYFFNTFIIWIK